MNFQGIAAVFEHQQQIATGFDPVDILRRQFRAELHGIDVPDGGVVIGDRVLPAADAEQVAVVAGAAFQVVIADIAEKDVVAGSAV